MGMGMVMGQGKGDGDGIPELPAQICERISSASTTDGGDGNERVTAMMVLMRLVMMMVLVMVMVC